MGDVIIDVPGGSNNHNYANVTLIVELARLHNVHAVWAGWVRYVALTLVSWSICRYATMKYLT